MRSFVLFCLIVVGLSPDLLFCQKTSYGKKIPWDNAAPVIGDTAHSMFRSADLIMLDERTEFIFYSTDHEKVYHHCRYLVMNMAGVKKAEVLTLPESFDPAYDKGIHQQGRQSKITIPYIYEYRLETLGARRYRSKRWTDLTFRETASPVLWIRQGGDRAGEFIKDQMRKIEFNDIVPGDIVDILYEASFSSHYGSNNFYVQTDVPKVRCDYVFTYKIEQQFANLSFIFPVNIPDDRLRISSRPAGPNTVFTYKYTGNQLAAINYPTHAMPGRKQPYFFADFAFYRLVYNSYPVDGDRTYEYQLFRPPNFEWVTSLDTSNHYIKIYDKQFTHLRKFLKRLPEPVANDTAHYRFFSAMCDTMNSYRYYSSNALFYGESNLGEIYSAENIVKRRIVEHQQWKLYQDILSDTKIFYYVVNVQDRRLGEHFVNVNINYNYQENFIAIPYKKSFLYFMPRYGGLKYHLGELPFYYEGSLACLEPRNFQSKDTLSGKYKRKFIRTHHGSSQENTRVENARIKISTDSMLVRATIKEGLAGQFSTILRHLYLGEYIDSTIGRYYFKRCVDKPGSSKQTVKLSSRTTTYPFRYSFNCGFQAKLMSKTELNLTNWFSFTLSKEIIKVPPAHDYFFDFEFTDMYNYVIEFENNQRIQNAEQFEKNISNEYFDLESSIKEQTESVYLVHVLLRVKKPMIPGDENQKFEELLVALGELNKFTISFGSKG